MNPIKTAFLVCAAFLTTGLQCLADESPPASDDAARAEARQKFQALHWVNGPQKVQMFGKTSLQVPADYVFLDQAETAKLQALQHNLGSGTEYFFAPKGGNWEVFFSYSDDGYVKDDEKIDAQALLKNIEDNTVAGNKKRRERGWDEMQVVGWQTAPHYDAQTNRLEWAIDGKDLQTNAVVVNFNTRILGRGGVTSAVLVSSPDALDESIGAFKTALNGFEYSSGQRYAEYKPGDKIAKYGLAALITGGAAAIAVKTGLWKVILGGLVAGWKLIAAAAVAIFGGLARRFRRKTG
ncbi:MAG TPA: DUF2167 domain-containing protein [Steroidobacteraceae bacterium]|nr:DUF2167 domain-containing protein [Steroidobacteraceae bacterium]